MNLSLSCVIPAAATAVLWGLSVAATPSQAQSHVEASGNYVLRASTASTARLSDVSDVSDVSDAMHEEHGIRTASYTAVLNVTVLHASGGVLRNMPARVQVSARNMLGAEAGVDMREVAADNMVSYLGTYRLLPREVLDFQITAYPEGAHQAITLQFRDRLGWR